MKYGAWIKGGWTEPRKLAKTLRLAARQAKAVEFVFDGADAAITFRQLAEWIEEVAGKRESNHVGMEV